METNREIYTRWYNGDKELRGLCSTQNALCKYLGVSNQLGSKFKKKIEEKDTSFNPQSYMQDNLEKILVKTLKIIQEKGSAKHIEMALKLAGLLIEKKESTVKVEYTIRDRQELTASIIGGLREDARITGTCSICGLSKALCDDPLLLAEPEYSTDREVEALEVST